jgi:hypothetical protein
LYLPLGDEPEENYMDYPVRVLMRRVEACDEFPLEALAAVAELRVYLEQIEDRAVESARFRGATWQDIADALGVSRQGLYQRHQNARKARA